MNRIQRDQYERTGRIIAFLRQNPELFTPANAPKLKAAAADRSILARLAAVQTGMEQTGIAQDHGVTRTQSAKGAGLRRSARDRLAKIRRGADTVAFQRGTPEIMRQFVIGAARSGAAIQGRMLAVAGAIETLGMEAELNEALLQPDVLPSLRAFIADFQKARDTRKGALLQRVRATSAIGSLISKARRLIRDAEAIVKNRLAPADPRYAAWQSAARVPRPALKARTSVPAPATVPASPSLPATQPPAPAAEPAAEPAAAPSPAVDLPAPAPAQPHSVLTPETSPAPSSAGEDGASSNSLTPAFNSFRSPTLAPVTQRSDRQQGSAKT